MALFSTMARLDRHGNVMQTGTHAPTVESTETLNRARISSARIRAISRMIVYAENLTQESHVFRLVIDDFGTPQTWLEEENTFFRKRTHSIVSEHIVRHGRREREIVGQSKTERDRGREGGGLTEYQNTYPEYANTFCSMRTRCI